MRYLLPALLLLTALRVQAEPVTIQQVRALQSDGFQQIDMGSHPAVILTTNSIQQIIFQAYLTGPSSGETLQFTLDRNGQPDVFNQPLPTSYPCCNNTFIGAWFTFIDLPYQQPDGSVPGNATLYKLNVQIVGGQADPNTYTFYVVKPIPEPTTLLLFVSGFVALALKKKVVDFVMMMK